MMNIENEILNYSISREIFKQISDFSEIICEWNEKINLISKNSVKDLWTRHILDSLQLIDYIPRETKTLVDIGSGSGFPAVVLAIVLQEKIPSAKVKMVESITKKTVYLNDVINRLNLNNAEVINSRVENTVFKNVDVITARAVAALDVLLSYQYKIRSSKTLGIYLKGQSYQQEIENARKIWEFACEVKQNKYCDDGVVLLISDLRRKK